MRSQTVGHSDHRLSGCVASFSGYKNHPESGHWRPFMDRSYSRVMSSRASEASAVEIEALDEWCVLGLQLRLRPSASIGQLQRIRSSILVARPALGILSMLGMTTLLEPALGPVPQAKTGHHSEGVPP